METKLRIFDPRQSPYSLIILKRNDNHQMILWNYRDDTFINGQWLTNTKIYWDSSDVSLNGKYFVYSYLDKTVGDVFTVISKPPYFAPLQFKREKGRWTYSGGTFLDTGEDQIDSGVRPKLQHVLYNNGLTKSDFSIGLRDYYVEGNVLYNADNKAIHDFTGNVFEFKSPEPEYFLGNVPEFLTDSLLKI